VAGHAAAQTVQVWSCSLLNRRKVMTRTIGRLADRLLSMVVPQTNASAATQTKCVACNIRMSRICTRDCINGVCEPWRCGACDFGC
jgi:hypothetical protein